MIIDLCYCFDELQYKENLKETENLLNKIHKGNRFNRVTIDCTKELWGASIGRTRNGGEVEISVWCEMDDIDALITDAEWDLFRSERLTENDLNEILNDDVIADTVTEFTSSTTLEDDADVKDLVEALNDCLECGRRELDLNYNMVKEYVKNYCEKKFGKTVDKQS